MSVREAVNRHAWVAAGAAVLLVGVAVVAVVRSGRSSGDSDAPPGATGLAHYTTDDGATWFIDDANKLPPFKKDGREMVRAYVYRDASGTEFVSHLERYTPEAQRALAAMAALPPEQRGLQDPASTAGGLDGIEVKRPKDTAWVRASDPRGQTIMQPLSPNGTSDGLTLVAPR